MTSELDQGSNDVILRNVDIFSRVLAVNVKYAGTEVMKISASAYEILMNVSKATEFVKNIKEFRIDSPEWSLWAPTYKFFKNDDSED